MAVLIGPTFGTELLAAGCGNEVVWSPDGTIAYGPDVTDAQKAEVAAVLAAHNPTKAGPRNFTGTQFIAALVDLGLKSFFDQAAAQTTKPLDAWYYKALTPNDYYLENNAKLGRICTKAMTLGAAAIPSVSFTFASVVDKAVTE